MKQQRAELTYNYWVNLVNEPKPSIVLRELSRSTVFPQLFPELDVLKTVPQGEEYHPEGNVFEHAMQAMDVARTLTTNDSEQDRMIIVFSALCHDFGKATHTQVHPDGKITSVGHAEAGVAPAGEFLTRINAPDFIVRSVQTLVSKHMVHVNACTPTAMRRLRKVLHDNNLTVQHLAKVVDSDTGGRSTASWTGYGDELLAVERQVVDYDNSLKSMDKLNGHFLIGLGFTPSALFKSIITEYRNAGLDLSDEELEEWVLSRFGSEL